MRARVVELDRPDLPLRVANDEQRATFDRGDVLFETMVREADGLGPLYVQPSCVACHANDARGPGLVARLAPVNGAASAASLLPLGDVERPYTVAGATLPLRAPETAAVRRSYRLPPAVFGRGYMEAVDDSEIEQLAQAARERPGPIRGRIHRVTFSAQANPGATTHDHQPGDPNLIGRFGLKARIASLDEFAADALQGDMGLTSPLRPDELPNPDGLVDDDKPGVDFDLDAVNALADYVRLLEIPERRVTSTEGEALFLRASCGVCHVPSLQTRSDYPIAGLAGIAAPVYTDFLLHEMGEALSDGVVEGDAKGSEWRTAPLIGLRFFSGYMHDGRAKTIEAAILAHGAPGSEAFEAVRHYQALNQQDKTELLRFVEAL